MWAPIGWELFGHGRRGHDRPCHRRGGGGRRADAEARGLGTAGGAEPLRRPFRRAFRRTRDGALLRSRQADPRQPGGSHEADRHLPCRGRGVGADDGRSAAPRHLRAGRRLHRDVEARPDRPRLSHRAIQLPPEPRGPQGRPGAGRRMPVRSETVEPPRSATRARKSAPRRRMHSACSAGPRRRERSRPSRRLRRTESRPSVRPPTPRSAGCARSPEIVRQSWWNCSTPRTPPPGNGRRRTF